MNNLLRSAVAALQYTRRTALSDPVTYQRGAQTLVNLAATPGQNEFVIDSALGVRIENDQQDFICAVADLILGGSPFLPERGDRIITADGTHYEIQSLDGTNQPYNLDQTEQQIRINTKRVTAT